MAGRRAARWVLPGSKLRPALKVCRKRANGSGFSGATLITHDLSPQAGPALSPVVRQAHHPELRRWVEGLNFQLCTRP